MNQSYDFEDETADCESAEDFFDHFGVAYDRALVQVYRLHMLQRFHDYLAARGDQPCRYADYKVMLERAHDDFARSDAQTEKVFRVFRRAAGIATVPLTAIGRGRAAP